VAIEPHPRPTVLRPRTADLGQTPTLARGPHLANVNRPSDSSPNASPRAFWASECSRRCVGGPGVVHRVMAEVRGVQDVAAGDARRAPTASRRNAGRSPWRSRQRDGCVNATVAPVHDDRTTATVRKGGSGGGDDRNARGSHHERYAAALHDPAGLYRTVDTRQTASGPRFMVTIAKSFFSPTVTFLPVATLRRPWPEVS